MRLGRGIGGLARIAPALFALLPPVAAGAEDLVEAGRTAYDHFCKQCHGDNLINPGTGSYDLRRFPQDDKARFLNSVTHGKGNMPAWGGTLYPEELEALWAYIATRGGSEPMPGPHAEAPPPTPGGLVEEGTLTVCLARNGGAMSGWRAGGGAGLDYRVAEAVAGKLGLPLDVAWFETEPEEESDPVRETYAMLAMGLCDLAPAHPLYASALGPPPSKTAAPPRWDDKPDWWGTKQVKLEPVAATHPYMRSEFGLVLGPAAEGRTVRGLKDLAGLRLGIQQGTLSSALAEAQAPTAKLASVETRNPGPGFLWLMEQGEFDAALVDVAAWDFHRRQNPVTALRLSDWRHPMGFNIGAAALASHEALIAVADAAIDGLLASGEIARMAQEEGVTWAAPQPPWVHPPITPRDILGLAD